MHEDLLNQLLFAIWEGGTMTIEAEGEEAAAIDLGGSGIALDALKVDPMLPLMIYGCGEGHRLQAGDSYVEAQLLFLGEDTHIGLWLNLEAPVNLTTQESEDGVKQVAVEILEIDPIALEVVINQGLFEGDDEGLTSLVQDVMLPMLIDGVASDAFAFDIPVIDLGAESEDIPEGTEIDLVIDTISKHGAYMTLDGGLSLAEPAPAE